MFCFRLHFFLLRNLPLLFVNLIVLIMWLFMLNHLNVYLNDYLMKIVIVLIKVRRSEREEKS